jgi:hypothetical protein
MDLEGKTRSCFRHLTPAATVCCRCASAIDNEVALVPRWCASPAPNGPGPQHGHLALVYRATHTRPTAGRVCGWHWRATEEWLAHHACFQDPGHLDGCECICGARSPYGPPPPGDEQPSTVERLRVFTVGQAPVTIDEVFRACVEFPGLRAVVVCERPQACADVFKAVRRLLDSEIAVECSATGYRLRFPHGSELWLTALAGAPAARRFGGVQCHLVVFDQEVRPEDRLFLTSRVRAAAGSGLPMLGAHPLADG